MACSGLGALPVSINDEVAEAVFDAAMKTGISIDAVSATYNMIDPNPSAREKGRRSFQSIAAVAHRMGTRLLTVCSGSCDPLNQWKDHRITTARRLGKRCA